MMKTSRFSPNGLKGLIAVFCLAGLMLPFSCTTGSSNLRSALITRPSSDLLGEADEYYKRGQYRTALVKYSSYVYSPFPDKKDAGYARYQLALCHYYLEQYPEAHETLTTLLKENPDFELAAQVHELQAKCANQIEQKHEQQQEALKELQQKIIQAEQRVLAEPNNGESHYQLADLYWQGGLVQKAVDEYGKAAKLSPELLKGETLRQRIRITDAGEFKVRDPMLEFTEDKVLKVVNHSLQRVKKSNWLGDAESLRVSGFVENTGLKDVKNVSIEVTLYDFQEVVQDTKMFQIGSIRAGAQRPFSVMMSNFAGDARDIRKYTFQLHYDE